eukprot:5489448-Pyramimonas_sp.AAC.1
MSGYQIPAVIAESLAEWRQQTTAGSTTSTSGGGEKPAEAVIVDHTATSRAGTLLDDADDHVDYTTTVKMEVQASVESEELYEAGAANVRHHSDDCQQGERATPIMTR